MRYKAFMLPTQAHPDKSHDHGGQGSKRVRADAALPLYWVQKSPFQKAIFFPILPSIM